MKKKIVSLILTAAFILTGCSKTETKQSQGSDNGSNETTVSSDVPVSTDQTTIPSDLPTGSDGTGSFNYGEALSKSLLFYELQRSGDLPDNTRCNWRGDSGLSDGSDAGIDLTGGWYDAGDHVKFNLPMAYSAAMIGWSVYEDKASYEESGQLYYVLFDIRWACDYLMKCHPEDEVFYYQVGDGGTDHSWWGPCEVMTMNRPSYKVTKDAPGSAVTGEAAAALAIASFSSSPMIQEVMRAIRLPTVSTIPGAVFMMNCHGPVYGFTLQRMMIRILRHPRNVSFLRDTIITGLFAGMMFISVHVPSLPR